MAWKEWDGDMPGGPRGFRVYASCIPSHPEPRSHYRRETDQRMSRMDKARKGQVQAVETGKSPLEVILDVMRNGRQGYTHDQLECAKAALPYLHARLANTTVTHKDAFSDITDDQLSALLSLTEWVERAEAEGGDSPESAGEPPADVSSVH